MQAWADPRVPAFQRLAWTTTSSDCERGGNMWLSYDVRHQAERKPRRGGPPTRSITARRPKRSSGLDPAWAPDLVQLAWEGFPRIDRFVAGAGRADRTAGVMIAHPLGLLCCSTRESEDRRVRLRDFSDQSTDLSRRMTCSRPGDERMK